MLRLVRKITPKKIFTIYHYLLSLTGAVIYLFPSRKIKVIGVTGTKGKSTTVELINAILEEAGFKTALTGTIHFKIGDKYIKNNYKMSMPGRFFMQKFISRAVKAKCDYIIIEMTSEGAKQFRHRWIDMNTFIFTNLSPEHIESHGSFEKYRKAKLSIAEQLSKSKKRPRTVIVNSDDPNSNYFLKTECDKKLTFCLDDTYPYTKTHTSTNLMFRNTTFDSPLIGTFNIYNTLAALVLGESEGIDLEIMKKALSKIKKIRGRVEKVHLDSNHPLYKKQNFEVVVDYAHTADSLEKLYKTFDSQIKICVLGNTGGGRDKWKRPEMGKVADTYCNKIILTNEDPYNEDPMQILKEMQKGIENQEPEIILDRRKAINEALQNAEKNSVVLITGKGTDPYIMEANGKKTPWDDVSVVKEELEKVLKDK